MEILSVNIEKKGGRRAIDGAARETALVELPVVMLAEREPEEVRGFLAAMIRDAWPGMIQMAVLTSGVLALGASGRPWWIVALAIGFPLMLMTLPWAVARESYQVREPLGIRGVLVLVPTSFLDGCELMVTAVVELFMLAYPVWLFLNEVLPIAPANLPAPLYAASVTLPLFLPAFLAVQTAALAVFEDATALDAHLQVIKDLPRRLVEPRTWLHFAAFLLLSSGAVLLANNPFQGLAGAAVFAILPGWLLLEVTWFSLAAGGEAILASTERRRQLAAGA